MSGIIERPDYIQYNQTALEEGCFTQEDIGQLEHEEAVFLWECPRAFDWPTSALVLHSKIILGMLALPVAAPILSRLISDEGRWQTLEIWDFYLAILFGVILLAFYALTRSQYHHIAYKITQSGMLEDNLKLYPKWRYRKLDFTALALMLRIGALILLPLVFMTNPLLLAGPGGLVLLSFCPVPDYEPEKAQYVPLFWDEKDEKGKLIFTKLKIDSRRKMVLISGDIESFWGSVSIFCNKTNFETVVDFIVKRLPHLQVTRL